MHEPVSIFWFRRDLRLDDNAGLYHALRSGLPVVPFFILDSNILEKLERDDARVSFIFDALARLNKAMSENGSRLLVKKGRPLECWREVVGEYSVREVYTNHDHEPYARERDAGIAAFLKEKGIPFTTFKDQVIFEKSEVAKDDGSPYTVYTPYMKKWFARLEQHPLKPFSSEDHLEGLAKTGAGPVISLEEAGFVRSRIRVPEFDVSPSLVSTYGKTRDVPFLDGTSHIGPYLRFGLIGIRKLVDTVSKLEHTYLKELVWREFFMQILWHFPHVAERSFREQYDRVAWINDEALFRKWCEGKTGYSIVDAGMRELKETGYMHNRVRMITASFLCKHLLTDWRWGEAWFAKHLLDFELSSNNGNWQWAAGTGCDAAPYFRVFNPFTQQVKFDPDLKYVKKWVPEYGTDSYPDPVVDHKAARERAISAYKKAVSP